MKVIDLLNKIANGEEVPKKIRFDDMIWNKICGEKNIYYINEYDSDLFVYFFRKNITFDLNDEIEIIEEDKKIRKIKVNYSPDIEEKIFYEDGDKPNHCILGDAGTELLINKINEIIDYINGGTNGE